MARPKRGDGIGRGIGSSRGVGRSRRVRREPEGFDRLQWLEDQITALADVSQHLVQQQATAPAIPVPPVLPPTAEPEGLTDPFVVPVPPTAFAKLSPD